MKKEIYERAELDLIRFETEDVIMDSSITYDEYEGDIINSNGSNP